MAGLSERQYVTATAQRTAAQRSCKAHDRDLYGCRTCRENVIPASLGVTAQIDYCETQCDPHEIDRRE